MSNTIEYNEFIFPLKFYSYGYLFIYASDENNIFGFIHPTPDISYTLEYEIPDKYVVDNMVDDSMEAMEL